MEVCAEQEAFPADGKNKSIALTLGAVSLVSASPRDFCAFLFFCE
jgi:hypothetical protein